LGGLVASEKLLFYYSKDKDGDLKGILEALKKSSKSGFRKSDSNSIVIKELFASALKKKAKKCLSKNQCKKFKL
jgi:hypothetical protein